jgi:hypothetical protein
MRRKPESTLWRSTAAVQKAASDGRAAKLRELRLADEAARREAGVWGELSVYEIVHAPTGAVFVHYWKNTGPNLGKPTRPAGLAAPEFEAYRTWLRQHEGTNFRLAKVAWNPWRGGRLGLRPAFRTLGRPPVALDQLAQTSSAARVTAARGQLQLDADVPRQRLMQARCDARELRHGHFLAVERGQRLRRTNSPGQV